MSQKGDDEDESVRSRNDDDDDGSDSGSDSGSDVGDPSVLYPDPLALIDSNADLDAVLAAKTIGEAIQLLCPNMPGLPCKQRGKYKKRRNLSENEKDEIMRARNRDNARRTRKRKKLYIAFLNNALEALESVLNPKEEVKDGAEMVQASSSSSSSVLEVHEDESSRENEQRVHTMLTGMRLPFILEFFRLRSSPTIFPEQFLPLCSENIVHSMPLPAHRDLSSLASIDASGGYECRGIDALVDDTRKRASFCDTLLRWAGANMQNWVVEAEIDENDVMLNSGGTKLSLQYCYKIYMVPISLDIRVAQPPRETWRLELTVPIVCLADFNEEGKICKVEEQFDVLDIIRQRDMCATSLR